MKSRLGNAWICFFIHFFIEVVCFAVVLHITHNNVGYALAVSIIYDVFAFYPQFLIGIIHEKYKTLNVSMLSALLMLIGVLVLNYEAGIVQNIIAIVLIALGNAFLHDCCAIQTTLLSQSTLFPTALFVGGGSFGVVIGTILSQTQYNTKPLLIVLTCIIMILLSITNKSWLISDYEYPKFNIVSNSDKKVFAIIIVAFLVTAVRSFMSYAIPIAWRKEVWQTILLFSMMGLGKILGGFLADKFGSYKVGIYSTLISIPFLIFGENIMIVSIIGVFLFSMTMSITYGMFLSVYQSNPGFAFGLTTLALGFGLVSYVVLPKFSVFGNIIMIVILSIVCAFGFKMTLRKE